MTSMLLDRRADPTSLNRDNLTPMAMHMRMVDDATAGCYIEVMGVWNISEASIVSTPADQT